MKTKAEEQRAGFWVHPSTRIDGVWTVDAVGPFGWFVDGFSSRRQALGWTLDYLTTVNENNARLNLEEAERKQERDDKNKLVCAALLEVQPKKGMEN